MKFAITGGTGFVGRNAARELTALGHEVAIIARGQDRRDPSVRALDRARFVAAGLDDPHRLEEAFDGCQGVAHCAGINRELGLQTFRRVHVEGTRNVVEAAGRAGVKKVLLLSFLRARPGCGSPYHETKFQAEEIVRGSGLDFTVLKAGVIYGPGDHLLDHLSLGLRSFPVFPLVGFPPRSFRPLAVEDVARLICASLVDGRLSRKTVRVVGPEELTLRAGIERVARAMGRRRALLVRCPVFLHRVLAVILEQVLVLPLASRAQVTMLAEGLVDAAPPCEELPEDLRPRTRFSEQQVRKGLPPPRRLGCRDLRLFSASAGYPPPSG